MVSSATVHNTLSAVTYKGFDQVGPAAWKKLIEYVQRVFEDKYWLDDGLQDESSTECSSESIDESDNSYCLLEYHISCYLPYQSSL